MYHFFFRGHYSYFIYIPCRILVTHVEFEKYSGIRLLIEVEKEFIPNTVYILD